ncbi:hypothetical protein OF83DRAFT_1284504 [Amylostereum chailletii]|nr:hypothetical protein OF83DRAFT_1284504 [Amylostereum chailletii]
MVSKLSTTPPMPATLHTPPLTHTSISRLPVETLSEIFSYLPYFEDTPVTNAPHWSPLLHVCRWWRQVAFDCRDLWRTVPIGCTEWTEMALERSKPGPIKIVITARERDHQTILGPASRIAARQACRAQEIILGERPISGDGFIASMRAGFMDQTAPNLTKLECVGYGMSHPRLFNGGPLPRLQSLSLSICVTHVQCPVFSAPLTSLFLDECEFRHSSWAFLSALALLPTLEHLFIKLLSFTDPPTADHPLVNLPHLKRLELTDVHTSLLEIARSVAPPRDAYVQLSCLHTGGAMTIRDLTRSLASVLARHFGTASSAEAAGETWTIDVKRGGRDEPQSVQSFVMSLSLNATAHPNGPLTEKMAVAFNWSGDFAASPTLPQLVAMFPLTHIASTVHFIVTEECTASADDWTALRDLIPSVKHITATRTAACFLLEVLRSPAPAPAPVAFPRLGEICVANIDFVAAENAPRFEALLEALDAIGHDENRKLVVVALVGCVFAPGMTDRLMKFQERKKVFWEKGLFD